MRANRAFTLVELMVAVTVLVLVMLGVGKIFSVSSDAAGRTVAHAELLQRLEDLRRVMTHDLQTMHEGLLIIDSPAPARTTDIEDPGGTLLTKFDSPDPPIRFRSDGLVFLSSGGPGLHRSFWSESPDPNEAMGDLALAASGEGVLFYGHSWPGGSLMTSPAIDWRLCRRAVVLLPMSAGKYRWTDEAANPPNGYSLDTLDEDLRLGTIDAVARQTLVDLIGTFSPTSRFWGLTTRSELPAAFSADPNDSADYFRRGSPLLDEHLGDFIIEWTDGETNTTTGLLNWYGRTRDVDYDGADDVTPSPSGGGVTEFGQYQAIWCSARDTWEDRPRALRITVRLYDPTRRITQAQQFVRAKDNALDSLARYGQEYSFLVRLP